MTALVLTALAGEAPLADAPRWNNAVTRRDLAHAYMELEREFALRPPPVEELAEFNRAADDVASRFFSGNFRGAVEYLHTLKNRLSARSEPRPELELIQSLRVEVEPPVATVGTHTRVTVRVSALYPLSAARTNSSEFRMLLQPSAVGTADHEWKQALPAGEKFTETIFEIDLTKHSFPEGRYRISLAAGELRVPGNWLTVTSVAFAVECVGLIARLEAASVAHAALAHAIATCRSRIDLLKDRPSPNKPAEFLLDPLVLRAELRAEVAALAAGQNPYRERAGDTWRAVAGSGREIALLIHAPPHATETAPTPRPLLIALHGAGGDEQMFRFGYGAGLLPRLADRRGFVLVTPHTESFLMHTAHFREVLESVTRDYAIDPTRVYLLGHSLGAITTASLAVLESRRLAATVCIAGGPLRAPDKKIAPMLIIGAPLDRIVPSSNLRRVAQEAQSAGQPVEFRSALHYGHLLVVAAKLEECVEWLLAHHRTE
ncbi:MAG: alpha/beta hydrolase family esterase [Planctomycetota bacterium]